MKYYAIAISNRTEFLEQPNDGYCVWSKEAKSAKRFESFAEASQFVADMKQDFSDYGVEVVMVEVLTKISNPPETEMIDHIRSKLLPHELAFLGIGEEKPKFECIEFTYRNNNILFDEYCSYLKSIYNGYIMHGGLGDYIEGDAKLSKSLNMLAVQRYSGRYIFTNRKNDDYKTPIPENREEFWEVLKKLIDDFDDNRGLFAGAGRIAS